jgi:hypothetical protein
LRICLIAALLLLIGCAARAPISAHWRLTNQGTTDLLIPPGSRPDTAKRTLAVGRRASRSCPARITITRDMFLNQPAGWLTAWASNLEAQGCFPSGEGDKLAARLDESLPIDAAVAYKSLYPKDVIPPVHFEVTNPIVRDPKDTRDLIEVVGGSGLNLVVKASDNLIGFEKALFAVQRKPAGPGFQIVPLRAERHIDGQTERRTQPEINYLHFPSEAAFYRVIVKSDPTDFTALVVAAPTRAELDRRVALLESGSATCATLNNEFCVAIPRRVAINAVLPVTVNGVEVMMLWGSNLGAAIRNAGVRRPEDILPTLAVSRLYSGRPTPLEFDRSNSSILRVPLMGGEVISWAR